LGKPAAVTDAVNKQYADAKFGEMYARLQRLEIQI